jgi:hypothetical protein
MPSNINFSNVDETYPISGIDNDSQGFRDNFTVIKQSLQSAKSEIDELQSKAVFKTALTGASLNNNFNGNDLSEANLVNVTEKSYSDSIALGLANISIENGSYQKFELRTSSTQVTFVDWPDVNNYSRLRLQFYLNFITPCTVTFSGGSGTVYYDKLTIPENSITVSANQNVIVDVWTDNKGQAVYLKKIGSFIDSPPTFNPPIIPLLTTAQRDELTPALGMIIYNETTNQLQILRQISPSPVWTNLTNI